MKTMNKNEMRKVDGGRWKCNKCKRVFNVWIGLWQNNHMDCMFDKPSYHWCF